ncbi:MAG: hypothetical protein ACPIOQ_24775 [Promethearchaeia archaeon]
MELGEDDESDGKDECRRVARNVHACCADAGHTRCWEIQGLVCPCPRKD